MSSDPFLGEIMIFAGNFAPRGWAMCNGQLLSIAQNTALFSILGTTYGGDGRATFALPDLRGRLPMHFGQGTGLTNRNLGEASGVETVTLTPSQLPQHTHAATATSGDATTDTSVGALSAASQPHDNLPPFLALNFVIALTGVFPARD